MTILYTVFPGAQYVNLRNLSEAEINKGIKVYVNATNRCPCACTFCERQTKKMTESNTLWLKREPTTEEIIDEFKRYPLEHFQEVVFCGFGEPLERVDDLMQVADYLKSVRPELPLRVNTNGLANQIHQRDIIPSMKGRIDTVSISLNAPDKESYYHLTRSQFGEDSFDYVLDFAKECQKYLPHVVMSVVDHVISDEDIAQAQKICDEIGVTLRVRPYEENE